MPFCDLLGLWAHSLIWMLFLFWYGGLPIIFLELSRLDCNLLCGQSWPWNHRLPVSDPPGMLESQLCTTLSTSILLFSLPFFQIFSRRTVHFAFLWQGISLDQNIGRFLWVLYLILSLWSHLTKNPVVLFLLARDLITPPEHLMILVALFWCINPFDCLKQASP